VFAEGLADSFLAKTLSFLSLPGLMPSHIFLEKEDLLVKMSLLIGNESLLSCSTQIN
jgi:hypothetical protein